MSASSESAALRTRLTVFNTFAFFGLFLNIAVLAPAIFSSRVYRRKTWYNLILAWIIYSVTYLLALGHQTGPEPTFGVCLVQAALVYAAPSLCAVASVCHAIDYYSLASTMLLGAKATHQWWDKLLRSSPWIIFSAVFVQVLLLVGDPSAVKRDPNYFYCQLTFLAPRIICAIILLISAAILLPLEIYTAMVLYRHWNTFRRLSIRSTDVSFSMFVRLAIFTSIAMIAVGMSAVGVLDVSDVTPVWGMILPIVPLLSALAFGTQRDILRTYMFWKKRRDPNGSSDDLLSHTELNGVKV